MDQNLIKMVEEDKELEYILKEVLFAKEKNAATGFNS